MSPALDFVPQESGPRDNRFFVSPRVSTAGTRPRSTRSSVWRRRSYEVITSEVVAGPGRGPEPPPAWEGPLARLLEASRAPVVGPSWWTADAAYFGNVETRTDPRTYRWDGLERLGPRDRPLVFFQLTLAGWGHFQLHGQPPVTIGPGSAFFAPVPSRHRYYLPEGSPGWTFAWIGLYHPYLLRRIARQVAATGNVVTLAPTSPLAVNTLRLVAGAFAKDFRDRFEVELALFELLFNYERLVQETLHPERERERILEWVRARILATPRRPVTVETIAAERQMSRSHFSHHFRGATGLSPAKFMTEVRVREAAHMLLNTQLPIKQVASEWGFANVNHFGKVFHRFHHVSPATFRRSFA